jgi:protein gp37
VAIDSAIEWTEATWNPTTGCTKISQGCKNCYAERLSKRLKAMGIKKYKNNFQFTQHENEVELPLKWTKPKKIFVNSMSDLFHKDAEMEFIGRCFHTMVNADWHIYQVLTKRPEIMKEFSQLFHKYFGYSIPNHIWMGTSIEDNDNTWRIDELRKVKSSMRFISFEPLLGPIDRVNLKNIDWAIIGGESGFNFRPVQKEWITSLIKQCKQQKVKVFFKQWGGVRPKSGGRIINGKTYSEYPKIKQTQNTNKSEITQKLAKPVILTINNRK